MTKAQEIVSLEQLRYLGQMLWRPPHLEGETWTEDTQYAVRSVFKTSGPPLPVTLVGRALAAGSLVWAYEKAPLEVLEAKSHTVSDAWLKNHLGDGCISAIVHEQNGSLLTATAMFRA